MVGVVSAFVFDTPVSRTFNGVTDILRSPLLSGSLLLAVTLRPDASRHFIQSLIARGVPINLPYAGGADPIVGGLKIVLKAVLALGLTGWASRALDYSFINGTGRLFRSATATGWDWPNEIAVVTGGSSGIGQDVVRRLADLGVRVAILDVQPPLDEGVRANKKVLYFECDVSSHEAVAKAADEIRITIGHPSILINNAGIVGTDPVLTIKPERLQKTTGVNLWANWFTTQQFLPHMIEANKGHILTVSSMAAFMSLPSCADYSATKAGVMSFHESLTSELRYIHKADGVATTIVFPAYARTPILGRFADKLAAKGVPLLSSGKVADDIVGRIKSGRGGSLVVGAKSSYAGLRGTPAWWQEVNRMWLMKTLFG